MIQFVILTVSLLNLFILGAYIWMMYKKRSQPSLAMWTFFTIAVAMSLVTYLKEGDFGFWDNVLNTTDLVLAVSVAISIFLIGDKHSRFNRFEWWCLVSVFLIIVFWLISQNHIITNVAIQLILVIAYIPVIRRMLTTRKNSEPFIVWVALMIAPLVSLITSKGTLATVYATRAFVCTSLLLLLMVRIEWLNRKTIATKRRIS